MQMGNAEWGMWNYGSKSERIPHSPFRIPHSFSVHARLTEHLAQRGHADFAELAGRDLPDLWVQQLERYAAGITQLPEAIDDRGQLEVAVARQNPIAVGGQLAGHA